MAEYTFAMFILALYRGESLIIKRECDKILISWG
jgi:hypothetical protein